MHINQVLEHKNVCLLHNRSIGKCVSQSCNVKKNDIVILISYTDIDLYPAIHMLKI